MNAATLLFSLGAMLRMVQGVSLVNYAPGCGVDAEFGSWYSELFIQNEDPTSTSSYTDFFAPNASFIILGDVATGPDAILRARGDMLPSDGSLQWNHIPNTTIVSAESATEKTFHVFGVLQTITTANGTCTTTDYQTLLTVAKNTTTGAANLIPHSGSLLIIDAFIIDPSNAPCTI
ncbi:hypothetical protein G7Z17_g2763 [Cylindrodendrum hubeiense]|uniref:Uncharacterized protein n=1 Tax=Cylindrodendrum hubeiense TaxID=595255 RepID=A0A9P5LKN7_9HYPO|nr:hypothetical protein G7Z17_g2763 [Cylindrodendrum hubeiense]